MSDTAKVLNNGAIYNTAPQHAVIRWMKERPFQPWSTVKAVIVVRFTYRNHLDEEKDYETVLGSISEFSNYLRWSPDKAQMLGYKKIYAKPNDDLLTNSRNSNVRLSIRYGLTKAMENEVHFKDVYELNEFLRANAEIAKALQYVRT